MPETTQQPKPNIHLRTCECGARFKTQRRVGHPWKRCPKCRAKPRARKAA
jgi:predicted SprT family Zn-dependent metalloprotease